MNKCELILSSDLYVFVFFLKRKQLDTGYNEYSFIYTITFFHLQINCFS